MTLERERWQRARSLFDELVELPADERRERLAEVGTSDPALRETVERLLDVDAVSEGRLGAYEFAPGAEAASAPDHSAAGTSHDPLGIVGHTVSHFAVKRFLAAGGMGVVYAAEDLDLGRSVALKFPLPNNRLDSSVKSRFVQEARSAASLDHPHLCTVHEVGDSSHGVFLAMPLYDGETLKERLAREGALAPEDAVGILRQVLAGLTAAHAAEIVHRDLKPGNVMLLSDGTVRILDFGLAKVRDVSQTRSRATLGTVAYMAPEQIRQQRVDARTDLWAIGVMLHEMLTGAPPFRGDHEISVLHAVLHDDPAQPSTLARGLPPHFDTIVAGLLQKDAAHRYSSADAVRADLDTITRGGAPAHRAPFWTRTPARRRARRAARPTLLGVAGIVAVGLIGLLRERGSTSLERAAQPLQFVNNEATVHTAAELVSALSPANAGRRIRVRAGTYDIKQLLAIPDGMTLEGEGVMRFDETGHPTGFREGTRTTLRMTGAVGGEVLTLGDRVTLRNVEIVDLSGRSGNVIGLVSRRPKDHVSAMISEVVVMNPNPSNIGGGGQLGTALRILTQNPNLGADPPPHDGSVLAVRVERSILGASEGGVGWFAFNFAPNSRITLELSHNVIGGTNIANGGVSRPDAVHDSEVRIVSDSNVYRDEWEEPCASPLTAWNLDGGSGAPVPEPRLAATVRNTLRVRSVGDRFERFTTGIFATASRRFFGDALNAPPADNRLELQLIDTKLHTATCPAPMQVADLILIGASAPRQAIRPGEGNTLLVEMRGVVGSGTRSNRYGDAMLSSGSGQQPVEGTSNRLFVVGDPASFAMRARGIDPAPDRRFFAGGRVGGHADAALSAQPGAGRE